MEDWKSHSRFQSFCDALSIALLMFEKAREWADLIQALDKLKKTLENSKFAALPLIPEPVIITLCKRLAQCLNPGLPDGVHLKALEVYITTLEKIDRVFFIPDLSLYSTGLFPLFPQASTRVKPVLLEIYARFYVPIGKALIPAVSGLTMSLLPGIEEDSSELYPMTMKLLHTIREVTDTSAFMTSLWHGLVLCPETRLASVNYLLVTLPKEKTELVQYLPADDMSIAVKALIATLHDKNILAQRKILELIASHFPLHSSSTVFTPVLMQELLKGALEVILRHDVSLTRRLYQWLLGGKDQVGLPPNTLSQVEDTISSLLTLQAPLSSENAELSSSLDVDNSTYFDNKSYEKKTTGFKEHTERLAKPFMLMVALHEKEEIRNSDLLELLHPKLIRYAFDCHKLRADAALRLALRFYAAVPSQPVWRCLQTMLSDSMEQTQCDISQTFDSKSMSTDANSLESCKLLMETIQLIDFAFDFLPVHFASSTSEEASVPVQKLASMTTDISTLVVHVLHCLRLFAGLNDHGSITSTVQLVQKLIGRLPHGVKSLPMSLIPDMVSDFPKITQGARDLLEGISSLNDASKAAERLEQKEYALKSLGAVFSLYSILLGVTETRMNSEDSIETEYDHDDPSEILQFVPRFFKLASEFCLSSQPDLACIGMHTWLNLLQTFPFLPQDECDQIAHKLWSLLHSSFAHTHFRVADFFVRLHKLSADTCDRIIVEAILHPTTGDVVEGYRRLTTLWKVLGEINPKEQVLSNSLLLMLDALDDARPRVRLVARTWLRSSLRHIFRLIDPLLCILLHPLTFRNPETCEYLHVYDARRVVYALRKLSAIILSDSQLLMEYAMKTPATPAALDLFHQQQTGITNSDSEFAQDEKQGSVTDGNERDNNEAKMEEGKDKGTSRSTLPQRHRATKKTRLLDFPRPEFYLELIALTVLGFLQGVVPKGCDSEFQSLNFSVQVFSAECLQSLLSLVPDPRRGHALTSLLSIPVLQALSTAVNTSDAVMQLQLLELLKIVLVKSNANKRLPENMAFASPIFTESLLSGLQINARLHLPYQTPETECNESNPHNVRAKVSNNGQQEADSTLSHWVDFAVSSLQHLRSSFPTIVFALLNVLCVEIQTLVDAVNRPPEVYVKNSRAIDDVNPSSLSSDMGCSMSYGTLAHDLIILLQGLKGVIHSAFVLGDFYHPVRAAELAAAKKQKAMRPTTTHRSKSFLGSLFSSSTETEKKQTVIVSDSERAQLAAFQMLPVTVETLVHVWALPHTANGFKGLEVTRKSTPSNATRKQKTQSRLSPLKKREVKGPDMKNYQGYRNNATEMFPSNRATSVATDHFVSSTTLNWLHQRKKLHSQVVQVLEPLLQHYPERLVGSFLHTWEKQFESQIDSEEFLANHHHATAGSEPLSTIRHSDFDYKLRKSQSARTHTSAVMYGPLVQRFIIDILNRLSSATPSLIIGSIVPVATEIILSAKDNNKAFQSKRTTAASSSQRQIGGNRLDANRKLLPLPIHETAAFHCLDRYMKECIQEDELALAWPALHKLCTISISHSSHPFAFLWLLGLVQQFVSKCGMATLPQSVCREVQHVTNQLISTCSLMAWQTLQFNINDHNLPLPSAVTYCAPRDEDSEFLPPLPPWLCEAQLRRCSDGKGLDTGCSTEQILLDAKNAIETKSNPRTLSQQLRRRLRVFKANSAHVSLLALRTLSNVMAELVHDVWGDKDRDKGVTVVQSVIAQIFNVLKNRSFENLAHASAAATILSSFSVNKFKYSISAWQSPAWNLFLTETFFYTDIHALLQWRWVVSRIVAEDKVMLTDLLDRCGAAGYTIFTGRKTSHSLRARCFKRLAFVLHSGRKDQYSRHLKVIIERIVEALKVNNAPQLHAQVLFCLRVMFARISPEHLTVVWPLVLMELIKIFQDESLDSALLLNACKLVDLALVLLPSQFYLYQWMFVKPALARVIKQTDMNDEGKEVKAALSQSFVPHLFSMTDRLVAQPSPNSPTSPSQSTSDISSSASIPPFTNLDQSLIRPLLTMRFADDKSQLAGFHDRLQKAQQSQSFSKARQPDMEFVDHYLLSDFVEYA